MQQSSNELGGSTDLLCLHNYDALASRSLTGNRSASKVGPREHTFCQGLTTSVVVEAAVQTVYMEYGIRTSV